MDPLNEMRVRFSGQRALSDFELEFLKEFKCVPSDLKNIQLNIINFDDPDLLCEEIVDDSLGDKYKHILERD